MGAKASVLALCLLSLTLAWIRSDRAIPGSQHTTELSYWNGFTGPDGRTMLELVRQFNRDNPDVNVTMQRIAWATYYNKLMVSAIDHRGPDVFVMPSAMLPRMYRAGFIDSMNDVYGTGADLKSDFDPRLLKLVDFGVGKEDLVGLPLDVHAQGLYCNAQMLKDAGFVNPDGSAHPPTNREEFLAVARAVKRDTNGDGRPDFWGFGYGQWDRNFMTLVPPFGGRLLDENGEPTLDDPGNVAALQFLADIRQKYDLAPAPEGGVAGWVGFRQQKVAMVFDGVYMLGDLKRLENHPYMGAPMPQIGPHRGTLGDSHIMCIHKGLDAPTRTAAARFVRFISDHSLDWADAGQVPARKSVRATDAFKKLQVQYAFSQQLDYVMYPPRTPLFLELQTQITLAVESAIRGRTTPLDALRQANRDFKRYVDRDREERLASGAAR
jgi:multiple sugar transport system substrate-binding protein